jgi:hypothetical protein
MRSAPIWPSRPPMPPVRPVFVRHMQPRPRFPLSGDPPGRPPYRPPEINIPHPPRPLKQVRYAVPKPAEQRSVTVCIAAICHNGGEPRIVLCADTRLDASWAGSSDGNRKIGRLAYGWVAMLSGHWSSANEIHSWLKAEFLAHGSPFDKASLYEMLSAVGKNFIAGPLYRKGKSAEIAVCGFLGNNPMIAVLGVGNGNSPHIDFKHSFAAIGTGQPIAETFLNIRDCKPQDSVERISYVVYEAKKYSEKAAGVGPETHLVMIAPPPPEAKPEQIFIYDFKEFLVFFEVLREECGIQKIDPVTPIGYRPFSLSPTTPPSPQHPTADPPDQTPSQE